MATEDHQHTGVLDNSKQQYNYTILDKSTVRRVVVGRCWDNKLYNYYYCNLKFKGRSYYILYWTIIQDVIVAWEDGELIEDGVINNNNTGTKWHDNHEANERTNERAFKQEQVNSYILIPREESIYTNYLPKYIYIAFPIRATTTLLQLNYIYA